MFFVSTSGDDAAPGSENRPWQTLGNSLGRLHAGDRLLVRGGTYAERIKVEPAAGRADAPIVVQAYPHERPLVIGQLWVGKPRYWTIDGIAVTWGWSNPDEPMVRFYGGDHWVLRDAEIFDARSTSALHVDDGPANEIGEWAVVDNCIHDTHPTHGANQDHNIYIDDMSRSQGPRGLIEGNVVVGAPNGRNIKLGPGGTAGGPKEVTVRDNALVGSIENIGLSQAAADINIEHNLLLDAREANIAAHELRGSGNIAHDNFAGGAPRFIDNGDGEQSIHVGHGNQFSSHSAFDRPSCNEFLSRDGAATARSGDNS
jgi:hypothetical protein